MSIAKSSSKLFAAKLSGAAIQFLGIAFFARQMGSSAIGTFFLFQALIGMFSIPTDLGLRGAVEKRISEGKFQGEFLASAIVLKIVAGVVISLLILLFESYINGYLGEKLAILLVFALLLQKISQLSIVTLKGELRVGETALIEFTRQAVWVGMGAALVLQGFGVVGLIYSLLCGYVIELVWGWSKVSVKLRVPSRAHIYSITDYSKYNVISSVGGYVYSWMDIAIIGLFLTQSHVAAYEIAWRVANVVILFSRAIANALFPQVSEWHSQGADKQIEELIPNILTSSLIFVIPSFFGTLLLSDQILGIVFGPEYVFAGIVLIILMFDQVTEAVQVVFGHSL
ncbi:oligosaccharide flippase family protein, partial [Haloferax sp. AB510]|uniref:oligosaccharide flippase family protein n=1 Tax=Haloferax sp. AB510 TaxID=2934172 RepID=UPI00209C4840